MSRLMINFSWHRDRNGYRVEGPRILRNEGPLDPICPFEHHATLFAEFAGLDDDPQTFAGFMRDFGPLTHAGHIHGEVLDDLITRRMLIRRCMDLYEENPQDLLRLDAMSPARRAVVSESWDHAIAKVAAEQEADRPDGRLPAYEYPPGEAPEGYETGGAIRPDKDAAAGDPYTPTDHLSINAVAIVTARLLAGVPNGAPRLFFSPDTLWDGLLLQFYQAASAGANFKVCEHCGGAFEVGPGGKRVDARFCSDKCRNDSHLANSTGPKS